MPVRMGSGELKARWGERPVDRMYYGAVEVFTRAPEPIVQQIRLAGMTDRRSLGFVDWRFPAGSRPQINAGLAAAAFLTQLSITNDGRVIVQMASTQTGADDTADFNQAFEARGMVTVTVDGVAVTLNMADQSDLTEPYILNVAAGDVATLTSMFGKATPRGVNTVTLTLPPVTTPPASVEFDITPAATFGQNNQPGWVSARNWGTLHQRTLPEFGGQQVNGLFRLGTGVRLSMEAGTANQDFPDQITIGSVTLGNPTGHAARGLGQQADYAVTAGSLGAVLRLGVRVTVELS